MMRNRSLSPLLALVLPLASACAGGGVPFAPVAYLPKPDSITNPERQTVEMIAASARPGCVAKARVDDIAVVVHFSCRYGDAGAARPSDGVIVFGEEGEARIRLDKIDKIVVEQGQDWARLVVHHRDAVPDFEWPSRSLEDIEKLVDALSALSHQHTKS